MLVQRRAIILHNALRELLFRFSSYAMASLLLPQENLTVGDNKAVQKTYSDVLYMDNNIFAWLCFIL